MTSRLNPALAAAAFLLVAAPFASAAPAPPTVALASDSGHAGDNRTNDTTPTFTIGGLADGATSVEANLSGDRYGTVVQKNVTSGSSVDVTFARALADGTWTVRARQSVGREISALSATLAIVVDTAAPTLSSVGYVQSTRSLTLTFSEKVDASSLDLTKLQINSTGSSSGGVTPTTATASEDGTALVVRLTPQEETARGNLTTPQLDVQGGAVADMAGNGIGAVADAAISITAPPGPPTGLATGSRHRAVPLWWVAPTGTATSYQYCVKTDTTACGDADWKDVPGSSGATTSYVVTGLTNATQYYFRVRALGPGGVGPASVVAPATPLLIPPTVALASDGGGDAADNLTNDATPTLTIGRLIDGASAVEANLSGYQHQRTVRQQVTSGNSVDVTFARALADGTWTVRASQTADGDTSVPSAVLSFKVDTTAPTVSRATYDDSTQELRVLFSERMDASTVDLSKFHVRAAGGTSGGSLGRGSTASSADRSTIVLTLDRDQAARVAGLTNPELDLDAGAVADFAGNAILADADTSVEAPPTTAAPSRPDLQADSDLGSSNSDDRTADATPTFTIGGVTAGASVEVTATASGQTARTRTETVGSGATTVDVTLPELPADTWSVTATQTANGSESYASAALSVQVETTRPTVSSADYIAATGKLTIVFSEQMDASALDVGKLHLRNTDETGTVTLTGAAVDTIADQAGLTVTLTAAQAASVARLAAAELDVDAAGAKDFFGNAIAADDDTGISVAAAAPAKPDLDVDSDSGASGTDDRTKDSTPEIDVAGVVAGAEVTVTATAAGRAAVTKSGRVATGDTAVALALGALADGEWTIRAKQKVAGTESIASAALTVAVDTAAPTLSSVAYNQDTRDLTLIFGENVDASSLVVGELHIREDNASTGGVTVSSPTSTPGVDGAALVVRLNPTQNANVVALTTPELDVDSGAVKDMAGNAIAAVVDAAITETTTPAPGKPDLETDSDLGGSSSDDKTADATPTFTVSGVTAGASVEVTATATDQTARTKTETVGTGATSVEVTLPPLVEGTWSVTAKQTIGGVASVASPSLAVEIDTTKPTVASVAYVAATNSLAITFSEKMDASELDFSKLHVAETSPGTGRVTLTGSGFGGSGIILFDTAVLTVLPPPTARKAIAELGSAELDVDAGGATDFFGNLIDTDADTAVAITAAAPSKPDLDEDSDSGGSGSDDITSDSTPEIDVGGVVPGAEVTVTATAAGQTAVTKSGRVGLRGIAAALTLGTLADGEWTIKAKQGVAGTESSDSTGLTVTVDTTPPTLSSAAYDETSRDLTLTFNEKVDASTLVLGELHIREDGAGTGGVTVSSPTSTPGTDAASLVVRLNSTQHDSVSALTTPELDLDAGAVKDIAGNANAASADNGIAVTALAAPNVPDLKADSDLGGSDSDDKTSDTTPEFTIGGVVAGASVEVAATATGQTARTRTQTVGSGNTSVDVTLPALVAGTWTVTATQTVGSSTSVASAPLSVEVETTAPTVSGAAYVAATRKLTVTFSEQMDASALDVGELHVRADDASTGGVTLTGAAVDTAADQAALTVTLTATQAESVAELASAELDVDADGAEDFFGNAIAADDDTAIAITAAAPAKPDLDDDSDTGASGTDDRTNDSTPEIEVAGVVAGANVTVTASASGKTDVTKSGRVATGKTAAALTLGALDDGEWTIKAKQDVGGTDSADSAELSVTVDTAAPALSSAAYDETARKLTLTFGETVDVTTLALGNLHIREDDASTGGQVLTGATRETTSDGTSVVIVLTTTQHDAVTALTTPELDIAAAAIDDLAGNEIAAAADQAISVTGVDAPSTPDLETDSDLGGDTSDNLTSDDTPTFTISGVTAGASVEVTATASGQTAVTKTETVGSGNTTVDVTLPTLAAATWSVTATQTVGSGVSPASAALSVTVETTKPTLSSAAYAAATRVLTLTFGEKMDASALDLSKLHIRPDDTSTGGVALTGATASTTDTTALTVTLTADQAADAAALASAELDVDAGGAEDFAGNAIAAAADTAITIAAAAPSIPDLTTDSGENTTDNRTSDDTPTFSVGGVVAGADVTVTATADGQTAVTATARVADSATSVDVTLGTLADAAWSATATQNVAGTDSAASSALTVTIDDTKPTLSSAAYAEATRKLTLTFGETVNVSTLNDLGRLHIREDNASSGGATLTGATVETTGDGTSVVIVLTTTQHDAVVGLTTPELDIDAAAIDDLAGNEIAAAADQSISVTGVAAPSTPDLQTDSDLGGDNSDDLTSDDTPTFTISGVTAGASVEVTATASGKTAVTKTETVGSGKTSVEVTLGTDQNPLAAAIWSVTAKQTVGSGVSPASTALAVTVETTKPTASSAAYVAATRKLTITFSEKMDASALDVGELHIRKTDETGTVTLTGATMDTTTDQDALTVTLTNAQALAVAKLASAELDVDVDGAEDFAGNAIAADDDTAITVTAAAPSAPDLTTDSGENTTDNRTNDDTPTFSVGGLVAGANVTVTASASGQTAVTKTERVGDSATSVDVTLGTLADGTWSVTAKQNVAGTDSAASSALSVTIDDTRPTVTGAAYVEATRRLTLTLGETVNVSTVDLPKLHIREDDSATGGQALTGATVETTGDGTSVVIVLTTTQHEAVAALTTPELDIDVAAVDDLAGNEIAAAADQAITVTGVDAPSTPDLKTDSDLGGDTSDNLTSATTPTFTIGGVTAGASVEVTATASGQTAVKNTGTVGSGKNTVDVTLPTLAAATWSVTATQTVGSGVSPASGPLSVTVETTAPTVSSAAYAAATGVLTITFSEKMDASALDVGDLHIRKTDETGTVTLTGATASTSDAAALTVTLTDAQAVSVAKLASAELDIDAGGAEDFAGNAIAADDDTAITVTAAAPSAPDLTTDSGENTTDNRTNDDTPTFSVGGVVAGANVTVTATATSQTAVTATARVGDSATSVNVTLGTLADAAWSVTAKQNVAGTDSAASSALMATIDDTAPTLSSAAYAEATRNLTLTFGETVNASTLDLTKLHIREDGDSSGGVALTSPATTPSTDGTTLTIQLTTTQHDAVVALTTPELDIAAAAVDDLAGNEIAAAADQTISVTGVAAPSTPDLKTDSDLGGDTSDNLTSDDTPTFTISGVTAGATVEVTATAGGQTAVKKTETVGSGNTTVDVTLGTLAAATWSVTAKQTVGSGVSPASASLSVVVETTAPTVNSAAYVAATKKLTITFSEKMDASELDVGELHIRKTDETGTVTLTGAAASTTDTTALTVTLTNAQALAVAKLASAELDIDAGGAEDFAGNAIAADDDTAITVTAAAPSTPDLTTDTGESTTDNRTSDDTPTFSVGGVVAGANVTVTATATSQTTVTATARVADSATSVDVTLGTLADAAWSVSAKQNVAGTDSVASSALTVTVDDTKPAVTAAAYVEATRKMTLTFGETVNVSTLELGNLHIREDNTSTGGQALTGATVETTTDGTSVVIVLTTTQHNAVVALTTPELDIAAAAIDDLAGNEIAAAADQSITVTGVAAPSTPDLKTDSDLGGDTSDNLTSDDTPTFTISGVTAGAEVEVTATASGQTAVKKTETVGSGNTAVDVTLGTLAAATWSVTAKQTVGSGVSPASASLSVVVETTKPTVSSAAYVAATRVLTVTFSEKMDASALAVGELHIRKTDETGTVTLTGATASTTDTAALTVTLTTAQAAEVAKLASAELDVDADGAEDFAGNAIAADDDTAITVTAAAPTTPDLTTDTGESGTDNRTSDDTPTISIGGVVSGANVTVTATASGQTAVTKTERVGDSATSVDVTLGTLADAAWSVTAKQNVAGTDSAASTALSVTIDDTKPTLTAAAYAEATKKLTLTFGETVNVSTLDLAKLHIREDNATTGGQALTGATVETTSDGASVAVVLTTTQHDAVVALTTPELDITAAAIDDLAGNEIAAAADQSITVTGVAAPSTPDLKTDSDLGGDSTDNLTSDDTPTFTIGGVTAGASVEVTATASGQTAVKKTETVGAGNTTVDVTLGTDQTPMAAATWSVTAKQTVGSGVSPASGSLSVTIETTKPTVSSAAYVAATRVLTVTFSEKMDASELDVGELHIRKTDETGTVTLTGATASTTDATALTVTLTTAQGAAVAKLASAELDVDAGGAEDFAGNAIAADDDTVIAVTAAAPSAPDLTTDTGESGTDNRTSDDTPTFSVGGVVAGANVTVRATASGQTAVTKTERVADSASSVNVTLGTLADAAWSVTAKQNVAGTESAASNALSVTIDDTKPTLSSAAYLESTKRLTLTFDETVNVSTLELGDLHIREDNASSGGTVLTGATGVTASDGTTVAMTLTNNQHTAVTGYATPELDITAGAIDDLAGNEIAAAADQSISVTGVAAPSTPDLKTDSDLGGDTSDNLTSDDTPTFTIGGVTAGAEVEVTATATGQTAVTKAETVGSGKNTVDVTLGTLAAATWSVTAKQTVGSGVSPASGALSVTVETTKPTVSSAAYVAATKKLTITFSEKMDASELDVGELHVRKTDETGTVTLTGAAKDTTTDQAALTVTLTAAQAESVAKLASAELDVDAGGAEDFSGNAIAADEDTAITVAAAAPSKPDLDGDSDSGASGSDDITNDATPEIDVAGVVAGANVTLTASASGKTAVTKSGRVATGQTEVALTLGSLADATWTIKAKQDVGGTESPDSAGLSVTVDTTAPTLSSAAYDGATRDLALTFGETVDASTLVVGELHIRADGAGAGSVTVASPTATSSADGATLTVRLSASQHNDVLALTNPELDLDAGAVRDMAGNANAAAADQSITLSNARGVTVSATTLSVPEIASGALGTGVYTLALDAAPSADVTVTVASDAPANATVAPTSLTFTAQNYATAQTVTVTAVDDFEVNGGGSRAATVSHSPSGGGYSGVSIAGVAVTVTDDDARGTASPTALRLSEDGGTATYAVRLEAAPTGNVTVTPTSGAPGNATVSPASRTFTTGNWSTPQTFKVTGVDDSSVNTTLRTATITHSARGGDYDNARIGSVTATLTDDEQAPPPPTGLTAVAGDGEIRLTWTPPAGYEVDGYEWCEKRDSSACSSINWGAALSGGHARSSATFTGRTNGTEYIYRLRSKNAAGSGAASNAAKATPVAKPAAPTALTAKGQDGKVRLSWTAPSGPVTGYEVRVKAEAGAWSGWQPVAGNATSHEVADLANRTAHTFEVRALNASGAGAAASATATPSKPPGRPTGLAAKPGDGKANLSWTAPPGHVTGFELCRKTGGAACADGDWTATGSTATTREVASLTNGTEYAFRVRSVNDAGTSAASDAVVVTPMAKPAAPTGLAATASATQVRLTWTDANDSTIAKYQLCRKTGATATCADGDWTDVAGSSYTTTSHTATGLANGTQYTFRIRAVNAAGAGAASDAASGTPMAKPAAPPSLTATAGDAAVTLAWTAPKGWPITGWKFSRDDGGSWAAVPGSDGATRTHTVEDLANGTAYTFKVRAVNGAGDGAPSASASATPMAANAPAAAQALRATVDDGRVTLWWTWAGAPDDRSSIVGQWNALTWEMRTDGGNWTEISAEAYDGDAAGTMAYARHTATGLANGTEYSFKLRATNAAGAGAESATVRATPTATPAPGAPTLTATTDGLRPGEVDLTFEVAAEPTPTDWELSRDGGAWESLGFGGWNGAHVVRDLAWDTEYRIRVRALNGTNAGPASNAVTVTTKGVNDVVPGRPENLSAAAGDGQATLTWTAPPGILTGWTLRQWLTNRASTETTISPTETDGVQRHVVTGLTNGTAYRFQVWASNAVGEGEVSDTVSVTPEAATSMPAPLLHVDARDAEIGLSMDVLWPYDLVTGWEYRMKVGTSSYGDWTSIAATGSWASHNVTGVANGTEHKFEARALIATGRSPASAEVAGTPEASLEPPGKPTLTATAGDAQATLTWHIDRADAKGYANAWQYKQGSGEWTAIPDSDGLTTSHVVTGLTNATEYAFRVRGVNSAGDGAASDEQTATPMSGAAGAAGASAAPPLLAAADARAREGGGATLAFRVTLSRAAAARATVDYATADGTATAGADYAAASGTLTFAPGETVRTVLVSVLDDAHDEGEETMRLTLSNAVGVRLDDADAVGVIANSDPVPQAWLARFGRAAAEHVTEAIGDRLKGTSGGESHLALGGLRLGFGGSDAANQHGAPGDIDVWRAAVALEEGMEQFAGDVWPAWNAGAGQGGLATGGQGVLGGGIPSGGAFGGGMYGHSIGGGTMPGLSGGGLPGTSRGLPGGAWRRGPAGVGSQSPLPSLRDALLGSSFRLEFGRDNDADGDQPAGPLWTAWGQSASTRFDGGTGGLGLDGEVTTLTTGVDAAWSRWLAGVALGLSEGSGGYRHRTAADAAGTFRSALASVHPYARLQANDRLSMWGVAGYGVGILDVATTAGEGWRTDTTMEMAAAGARWLLAGASSPGGLELALRGDAAAQRTRSAAARSALGGNLAAADGQTSRVRLMLEAERGFPLFGTTLTPSLAAGVRRDGGDAETGFGVELSGGLRLDGLASGLALEARANALVAHEDAGYREWGVSGTARLGDLGGRGLSLSIRPQYGAPERSAESFWDPRQVPAGTRALTGALGRGLRVDGTLGYGITTRRGVATPYLQSLLGGGADGHRAGIGWTLGPDFELKLEAERREGQGGGAEHGAALGVRLVF